LGKGTSGHVHFTKWLDFDTATKVIEVNDPKHEEMVWKEASILGALNHPSIIKLFCCGFARDHLNIKKLFHCGLMRKNHKMFEIVIERGTMNLLSFLKQQTSFNEKNAIDIMLQIASGMCYLHDMEVAHRDLKPDNVVLTSNDSTSVEHVHVKLVDFGISKSEVTSSSKVPTSLYGTRGYTAPEALEKKSKVDAFKMDVFSFAMMFSEILLRRQNFDGSCNYTTFILNGERPELPQACSEGLKSLIHKCWSREPSKRPKFLDILKTLRKLKSDAILETFHDVLASKQSNEPTFISGLKLGNTTSFSRIEEQSKNTSSNQMQHEVNTTLSIFICKESWMNLDQ
jgi:serine/threonine protein kinase